MDQTRDGHVPQKQKRGLFRRDASSKSDLASKEEVTDLTSNGVARTNITAFPLCSEVRLGCGHFVPRCVWDEATFFRGFGATL